MLILCQANLVEWTVLILYQELVQESPVLILYRAMVEWTLLILEWTVVMCLDGVMVSAAGEGLPRGTEPLIGIVITEMLKFTTYNTSAFHADGS